MFAVLILALFVSSICRTDAKDSADLTKNSTLLKKIDNIVIRSRSKIPTQTKNEKNKINDELDNEILISSRKNLGLKKNAGVRQPKFFGSLAFLTGLGAAAGLANAAAFNANTIVKLFNTPAVPIPIGHPGYLAGFYEAPNYLPLSYPVFYPIPRFAGDYQNFANGIPIKPTPVPQEISNVTTNNHLDKSDNNFGRNDETNKSTTSEKILETREVAATQLDLKENIASDTNEDIIISAETNDDIASRQGTVTTVTPTTIKPKNMSTSSTPNINTSTTLPPNNTESLPFHGYYGGSPQEIEHIKLIEDSPKTYLNDYTQANRFSLPFERPAVFNRYQNNELPQYQTSYVHSFSPDEPYPEFLNTIDNDRYVYDSENRRNYNGFKPIFK